MNRQRLKNTTDILLSLMTGYALQWKEVRAVLVMDAYGVFN
jgi:hypothetical protein